MDGQLVSGSPSFSEGENLKTDNPPLFTYTEKFYEALPYYLSIGMSLELFWDGDPTLVKYYRQADEMAKERRNEELWLQGMYIYEALCDVSPVLNSFAKKGTKPRKYSAQPYPITEKQQRKIQEDKARALLLKGKRLMNALMLQNNERFEQKSAESDPKEEKL